MILLELFAREKPRGHSVKECLLDNYEETAHFLSSFFLYARVDAHDLIPICTQVHTKYERIVKRVKRDRVHERET